MTVKGSNFHFYPHHGGGTQSVPVEGNLSCAPPPGPVTGGTGRHMCAWITNPPTYEAPLLPSLAVEIWHGGERTWGIRVRKSVKVDIYVVYQDRKSVWAGTAGQYIKLQQFRNFNNLNIIKNIRVRLSRFCGCCLPVQYDLWLLNRNINNQINSVGRLNIFLMFKGCTYSNLIQINVSARSKVFTQWQSSSELKKNGISSILQPLQAWAGET